MSQITALFLGLIFLLVALLEIYQKIIFKLAQAPTIKI
jgi:hypothetical protein